MTATVRVYGAEKRQGIFKMNTALAQQIANEGGVEARMIAQQHKSLLRFLTCGSVDDGKVP